MIWLDALASFSKEGGEREIAEKETSFTGQVMTD